MIQPYPPRSPDLMAFNFWFFPKVQMTRKCEHFEIIQNTEAVKALMKDGVHVFEARWNILKVIFYCNKLERTQIFTVIFDHII